MLEPTTSEKPDLGAIIRESNHDADLSNHSEAIGNPPSEMNNTTEQLDPAKEAENLLYKPKYRGLKRKLYDLVYKNEYLQAELRRNHRKLNVVQQDKYFLLERMLQYEKPVESPEPTPEVSDNSDNESSSKRGRQNYEIEHPGGVTFSSAFSKMRPLPGSKRMSRKGKKAKFADGLNEETESPMASGFVSPDEDVDEGSNFVNNSAVYSEHQDEDSD